MEYVLVKLVNKFYVCKGIVMHIYILFKIRKKLYTLNSKNACWASYSPSSETNYRAIYLLLLLPFYSSNPYSIPIIFLYFYLQHVCLKAKEHVKVSNENNAIRNSTQDYVYNGSSQWTDVQAVFIMLMRNGNCIVSGFSFYKTEIVWTLFAFVDVNIHRFYKKKKK